MGTPSLTTIASGTPHAVRRSAADRIGRDNLRKLPGVTQAEGLLGGDPDSTLGAATEQQPVGPDATDARLAALRRAETEKKLREARGAKSSFLFGGSDTTGNGFKPDNILGSRR